MDAALVEETITCCFDLQQYETRALRVYNSRNKKRYSINARHVCDSHAQLHISHNYVIA